MSPLAPRAGESKLHKNDEKPLPAHIDPQDLAEQFADFFANKIKKISKTFKNDDPNPHLENTSGISLFYNLEPATMKEKS